MRQTGITTDISPDISPDSSPWAEIPAFIGMAFWVVLGAAVIVRITVALLRRRPGDGEKSDLEKRDLEKSDIKKHVLEPFARSAAVQSEAYGWPPAISDDVLPMTAEKRTGPPPDDS